MRRVSEVRVRRRCTIACSGSFADDLKSCLAGFSHVVAVFDLNTQRFKDELESVFDEIGIRANSLVLNFHGEAIKSLEHYLSLVRQAASLDFLRRKSCFVAVGGGSLTDLVGYVAATYLRGVSYINVPTTLLGMADASIGGKVGLNLGKVKHLLGSFHYPEAVLIDVGKLDSLSSRVLAAGFGEVVKTALIAGDSRLFDYVEGHARAARAKDPRVLEEIVRQSIEIKLRLVEPDWQEEQLDRLLNLGHEIAHALEATVGFDDRVLMHGEAVASGIVAAVELAKDRDLLTEAQHGRIAALIRGLCGVVPLGGWLAGKDLLASLGAVERVRDGDMRVVLPCEKIGHARVYHDVLPGELVEALTRANLLDLREGNQP
jgi:3-dehydroquinate synthase